MRIRWDKAARDWSQGRERHEGPNMLAVTVLSSRGPLPREWTQIVHPHRWASLACPFLPLIQFNKHSLRTLRDASQKGDKEPGVNSTVWRGWPAGDSRAQEGGPGGSGGLAGCRPGKGTLLRPLRQAVSRSTPGRAFQPLSHPGGVFTKSRVWVWLPVEGGAWGSRWIGKPPGFAGGTGAEQATWRADGAVKLLEAGKSAFYSEWGELRASWKIFSRQRARTTLCTREHLSGGIDSTKW